MSGDPRAAVSSPVELEEVDRNARAYGYEVGRGHPLADVIASTSDSNPFLSPDWRDRIGEVDPTEAGVYVEGVEGRAVTFGELADAFDTWAARYLDDPEGDWLDVGVVGYGPACARYLFDLLDERAPEYEPIDAADSELVAGEHPAADTDG